MDMTNQPRLTQTGPICRWLIYLETSEAGWSLRVQHAHVGGLLSDCATAQYQAMTAAETIDVLDGTLHTVFHPEPPE